MDGHGFGCARCRFDEGPKRRTFWDRTLAHVQRGKKHGSAWLPRSTGSMCARPQVPADLEGTEKAVRLAIDKWIAATGERLLPRAIRGVRPLRLLAQDAQHRIKCTGRVSKHTVLCLRSCTFIPGNSVFACRFLVERAARAAVERSPPAFSRTNTALRRYDAMHLVACAQGARVPPEQPFR